MTTYLAPVWPLHPEGPNGLLAKSLDKSIGDEPETLAEHTWLVMSRLADQYRLRPRLSEQIGQPRLWHRMFWACFLHDFGKAAKGFQSVLRGEIPRWPHRHEVLSLAFVDWLFPLGHKDREWIVAAIASHHKEPFVLYERYLAESDAAQSALESLSSEIDATTLAWLWQWANVCPAAWAGELGMTSVIEFPPLLTLEEALVSFSTTAIQQALDEFNQYDFPFDDFTASMEQRLSGIFLRGLIFTSDHSASGHADSFPSVPLTRTAALPKDNVFELNSHQRAADQGETGSAILIAPTGSGKTEAALLWAARQTELDGSPPPRLFYALPYQASMNAMKDRLADKHFSSELVGIQHGKAVQHLYQELLTDDGEGSSLQQLAEMAKRKRELANLGYYPVRVFSPYQMLKAAYSLKGFEQWLVDYHGGLFIFDEIHAYEPKRLALVVELIRWLREHFAARFLIMTATLPPTVEQALRDALPNCQEFRASAHDYAASQRHIVHLVEDDLLSESGLDLIQASLQAGKSTLVCVNIVDRAIQAFECFRSRLPEMADEGRIILIHGRFNSEDRNKKERLIQDFTGVGVTDRRPTLVISTQVVEVSLNIDLDTLYTDPAPLEALLQRFGRVNRRRSPGSPLCDVYIFRQPNDGQKIYAADLVQAGLRELEAIDGCPIDEAQVSNMLQNVYSGQIRQQWEREYVSHARNFRESTLEMLRPYHSADRVLAERFYELFDGIEVLPLALEPEYERRRKESYLDASMLFVPMSFGQYKSLKHLAFPRMNTKGDKPLYYVVDAAYDSQLGLDLAGARERLKTQSSSEDY